MGDVLYQLEPDIAEQNLEAQGYGTKASLHKYENTMMLRMRMLPNLLQVATCRR